MRIWTFAESQGGIQGLFRHNLNGGLDKMDANTVMFRWVVDFFTALDLGRNNQLELAAGLRVQSGILAVIGGGPFRRTVDGGIAGNIAAKRPDHDDCARLEGGIRLEIHSGPAVVAGHRSMTI